MITKNGFIPEKNRGTKKELRSPSRTAERLDKNKVSFTKQVKESFSLDKKDLHDRIAQKAREIEALTEILEEDNNSPKNNSEVIETLKEQMGSNYDVMKAAEESDANLTKDEERKIKGIERKINFRKLAGKASKVVYGLATVLGLVAPSMANAQDKADVADPEDLKHHTEIFVDNENKILPNDNTIGYFESQNNNLEGGNGDGDKEDEHKNEQELKDKQIYDKHEQIWEKNDKYYVRDGNDLRSVIRHSLHHLEDTFKNPSELRNSIYQIYDGVLTPKEISDLYSFIENGGPEGKDGALNREDVKELQNIYNKIASAPSDSSNDSLTGILESNSSQKGGEDGMQGIATALASKSLMLEGIGKILVLSGIPVVKAIGPDMDVDLKTIPNQENPELRGYSSLTIEQGNIFDNNHQLEIKSFTEKVDGLGDLDNIGDFIKKFQSSDFDKIEITGMDVGNNINYNGNPVDFDTLDDLGTGSYKIHNGNYDWSFDYKREDGGDVKTFSNIEIKYNSELGEIKVSVDEAARNLNGFDKNDPNSEGYTRSLKNFKLDAFGEVKIDVSSIYKYETAQEVGGRVDDVKITVGNWTLNADDVSAKYKTPNGVFDFNSLLDDVWKGENGVKAGDLIERFEVKGGPISLENADGSIKIKYDGKDLLFSDHGNDYRIFRNTDGNFTCLDSKGVGAVYEGGFETYTILNGKNVETKDFINNLVNEGATAMIGSPNVEVGVSAMGGFLEMNTGNIESNITKETLEDYRKDLNETSQKISDLVNDFSKKIESGNAGDMITEGVALKTQITGEIGGLIDRIADKGEIKMDDWKIKLDFKALSDNFKLMGNPGAETIVYKLDVFLGALGNDLGQITLNKEFIDGYKESSNKADFVVDKVWGEKLGLHSVKELTDDFLGRAGKELGGKLLELSSSKIMDVISATNNGSVEGLIVSPDEVQVYYNFCKKLNPEGFNFIAYANANLGEDNQNQEMYVNILDTKGKEHLTASAGYKDYGGVGLIATKVLVNEGGTLIKALGGANVEFVQVTNAGVGFTDGIGHNYKLLDGENFFKLADMAGQNDYVDLLHKTIENKSILPTPSFMLGFDARHDIIGEQGGKTTIEASLFANTNYLHTSLNLSLGVERDLGSVTGLPLTVGGKVNMNDIGNGHRYGDVNGQVYLRWDIGKIVNRYTK